MLRAIIAKPRSRTPTTTYILAALNAMRWSALLIKTYKLPYRPIIKFQICTLPFLAPVPNVYEVEFELRTLKHL